MVVAEKTKFCFTRSSDLLMKFFPNYGNSNENIQITEILMRIAAQNPPEFSVVYSN